MCRMIHFSVHLPVTRRFGFHHPILQMRRLRPLVFKESTQDHTTSQQKTRVGMQLHLTSEPFLTATPRTSCHHPYRGGAPTNNPISLCNPLCSPLPPGQTAGLGGAETLAPRGQTVSLLMRRHQCVTPGDRNLYIMVTFRQNTSLLLGLTPSQPPSADLPLTQM